MTFTGWTLPQLGMLFGIAGSAVTLLYLLRMRRRKVTVPFAALWERVTRESESRQIWRRLRRLLSWLIQLIVLGLICMSLGDPRPEVWLREPTAVAIVIDRSASMAGPSTEEGRSRLDVAKSRAAAEARGLGPADQAVVIAAGEEVNVAAPLSSDPAVLVPAIEDLQASYGETDLGRALALADHAVRDKPGPRILVLTDGAFDPAAAAALTRCREGPVTCEVVEVKGPTANVAITAFAARRYPDARDKIEVLAEVRNLGDDPAAVYLDVEAEGVSVGRRRLELAAGQKLREVLPDLDAARAQLVARLEPADDAPGFSTDLGPAFDDIAYAVVPPLKPLEIALVSDGTDLFLDAALLTLGEHVRLTGVSVEDASAATPPKELTEADVAFYDVGAEPLPPELPETHVVFFDPWRHEESPCPIAKGKDVARPFLTEQAKKHPILDHVVFKDVNIARGTTLVAEPGDTVLVRSLGEPLVVMREQEHINIAVGFDPRQSDFALRVAFPLFVNNLVQYVEQRTPGFVAAVSLGQSRELRLADLGLSPEGVTRVRISAPEASPVELPVEHGKFRLRALVPGIYGIQALDGESEGTGVEVAVNQASVDASDLHGRLEDIGIGPEAMAGEAETPVPVGDGPLWTLILLAAATILAVEWATYHRRVTV